MSILILGKLCGKNVVEKCLGTQFQKLWYSYFKWLLKFLKNIKYSNIKFVFCCKRCSELLNMLAEDALTYQITAFSPDYSQISMVVQCFECLM